MFISLATAVITYCGLEIHATVADEGLMAGLILPGGVALCYFLAANSYFKEYGDLFDASILALNAILFFIALSFGLYLYIKCVDSSRTDMMAVHLMTCLMFSIGMSYFLVNIMANICGSFSPLEFGFVRIELNYMAGIFTILSFVAMLDPDGNANYFISYMGGCTCLLDFMTGQVNAYMTKRT